MELSPALKLELKFMRLEQDLFEANPEKLDSLTPLLMEKYGEFFDAYCEGVLNIGTPGGPGFNGSLKGFITDPNLREVYKECKYQYADFSEMEAALTDGFSRYHQYFPDSIIPEVVTNISGFNYAVVTTPNTLGIGLEMYLGEKCIYYSMLGLPQYKVHFMRKESLPSGAIKGWLNSTFPINEKAPSLLSQMVNSGKILYAMDKLLPNTNDSIKIDYTALQMAFVNENEGKIWSHFLENKLLYTTDSRQIMKYMSEGPFTTGLPPESPARLGEYMGWQIVKRFMQNNSDVSLQQLFAINDAQDILSKSKYKPNR